MATASNPIARLARSEFVSGLCDLSFERLVTLKVAKVVYLLGVFLTASSVVRSVWLGFELSTWIGVWFLVISPLLFLLGVTVLRVFLEALVSLFRIEGHLRQVTTASARPPE
jgi:hypothetical protein